MHKRIYSIALAALLLIPSMANAQSMILNFGLGGAFFVVPQEVKVDFDLVTPGIQGHGATGIDYTSSIGMPHGDFSFLAPGSLGVAADAVQIHFSFAPNPTQVQLKGFSNSELTTITWVGLDAFASYQFEVLTLPLGQAFKVTNGLVFSEISSIIFASPEAVLNEMALIPEPGFGILAAVLSALALGLWRQKR